MMDRDTKLIAILRWQYHIILTALGGNIFRNIFSPNLPSIQCGIAVSKSQLVYKISLQKRMHIQTGWGLGGAEMEQLLN